MVRELPKQFEDFGEARQKGFLKVKNIKDNGGKVAGVFCTFTPLEILDAAGFTPVSLCGMSGETIPAAEAHLPKNLYKRNEIGYTATKAMIGTHGRDKTP